MGARQPRKRWARRALALGWMFCAAVLAPAQSDGAPLLRPSAAAYDAAGDLFIADSGRNQVFEISIGGVVSVVAGTGVQGFSGDGGPAAAAELNEPQGIAVGPDGTIYIADTGNQRVRAITDGTISTVAGAGAAGFRGDGGAATSAQLDRPLGLAIDASGALLLCDSGNQRVRRVSAGTISTVAGDGVQGFSGDGATAAAAELNSPMGVAAAANGRIFIADTGNHRVRVVSAAGIISTFAGTGRAGYSGDGGAAASAQLDLPAGVAVTPAGTLLVADQDNHRVRQVDASGVISTIAGSGVQGGVQSGVQAAPVQVGVATQTSLNLPAAVAVAPFGWPAVIDSSDATVRLLLSDGRLYQTAGMAQRSSSVTLTPVGAAYGSGGASVNATSSPGTPQGVVTISDGATVIASAPLASGVASIALPALPAGAHTLTAQYAGDGVHPAAAASAALTLAPLQVVSTAQPASMQYGAGVPALTGTLSGVLPQDTVQVGVSFSSAANSASPPGGYAITAALTGAASANYTMIESPNSGALTITRATTVASVAPVQDAYAGLPMMLSANVASSTTGTPTGTVQFLDAGSVVATASLVNGTASAVYLAPASGQHPLTASYGGDANFFASISNPQTAMVEALPDFTLGISGAAQQTVPGGATASYTLAIGSQAQPFTGAVTFSVSGLPSGATASFSPPAVVPGSSTAPVVMTVVTAPLASRATPLRLSRGNRSVLAALLFLPLFAFSRRRRWTALSVLAVSWLLLAASGCGARTASETALNVQSFTLTVKGAATNLAGSTVVHTASVTLQME